MELPAFIENTRTLLSVLTRYLDDLTLYPTYCDFGM